MDKENHLIENVKEGGSFEFRVAAFNDVGSSGWFQSDPIAAVSMFKVPEPPRFVKIDEVNRFEVVLTWQEPLFDGGAPITRYTVEKKEKIGQRWIPAGDTEAERRKLKVKIYFCLFY